MFKRKNKYRATRTALGFPSKLEEAVYFKLKDREILGEIRDIKRQQTVVLQEGSKDTRIAWKIDFSFIETLTGELAFAEAKGVECATFKLKLKLYRANPPARLYIYRGNYRSPYLVEIIEPLSRDSNQKGVPHEKTKV